MAAPTNMKFRKGSSFTVEFPTVPSLTRQPRSMELRQVQDEHDLVTLKFLASSHLWSESLLTGTPIKVVWGTSVEKKNWYGYVSFVTRTTSASPENLMEVHCVGTTFPLKERATKVFYNTTIPSAVKEIVESFGFKYIGEEDERVFEQLTIAGHSYWEWIQEQANRIGYAVLVEGMQFIFKPIDRVIDQGVKTVPIFSFSGSQVPNGSQLYDRTLDFFRVSNGEYVEDPAALRTMKQVGGVSPITAKAVHGSASPAKVGTSLRKNTNDVIFSEVRTDQVVHSLEHSRSLSEGAANLARMNTPAKAVGQGDVNVRPYYPVYIKGTGDNTDGFWVTKEAVHTIAREGEYQIRMTLGVDGSGPNRATERRPALNSRVGVVNLSEALNNDGRNVNALGAGSVRLTSSSAGFNEKIQGFRRRGDRWAHVSGRSA